MRPEADLAELAERIKRLSPADSLRLAADLLDRRRSRLARSVARRVVEELGLALAVSKLRDGRSAGG